MGLWVPGAGPERAQLREPWELAGAAVLLPHGERGECAGLRAPWVQSRKTAELCGVRLCQR